MHSDLDQVGTATSEPSSNGHASRRHRRDPDNYTSQQNGHSNITSQSPESQCSRQGKLRACVAGLEGMDKGGELLRLGPSSWSLAYARAFQPCCLCSLHFPFPFTVPQALPLKRNVSLNLDLFNQKTNPIFTKAPSLSPQPLTDLFPGLMQLWSILW